MDIDRKNASESIAPLGANANDHMMKNQPDPRYECPICLNWLREPVLTTCGHRYCKNCITSWLQQKSNHCPIDNKELKLVEDIFPDNYTRREILEQRIACPFIIGGCKVKIAPFDLDTHIEECPFNTNKQPKQLDCIISCTFNNIGCKATFKLQKELNIHLQNDIQSHLSQLVNAYSEIKIHKDMASSSCKEYEAMHMWDAAKPSDDNTGTGLIRALYERVVILEQSNREQNIIIENMSRQLDALTIAKRKQTEEMALQYCMGTYIWMLDNFQSKLYELQNDPSRMLYSPGFFTSPNGYKFCMRLNISPQNSQCFALHVHLMKSELDDCLEWPFNGRISLVLVNTQKPEYTQRDTMMSRSELVAFQRPTSNICPRGFGYTEYAFVNQVINNGFISGDSLKIKISIKPV